jgi:hypothetical protein
VALLSPNVSEKCVTSIIWVKRISELGTTLAVTATEACRVQIAFKLADSFHPDDKDDTFLRNDGS